MPASNIGAAHGVVFVLHEFVRKLFQFVVQVSWTVIAKVDPRRKHRHDLDLYARRDRRFFGRRHGFPRTDSTVHVKTVEWTYVPFRPLSGLTTRARRRSI